MTNCMHCGSLLTSAGCMRCDYGQMIESGQPGVWVTEDMLEELREDGNIAQPVDDSWDDAWNGGIDAVFDALRDCIAGREKS